MRYVFDTQITVHYRFPTHVNDLVMDRAEANTSEAFIVVLEPGEAPPLHVHHDTEQIFYVLEGTGVLYVGEQGECYPVAPGDLCRIPAHIPHRIHCNTAHVLRYLSVDCFLGGRPDHEPTWDSHVRVICAENGWNFDQVKQARPSRDEMHDPR